MSSDQRGKPRGSTPPAEPGSREETEHREAFADIDGDVEHLTAGNTTIDIHGGPHIEGSVNIQNGDFVGRDKITIVQPAGQPQKPRPDIAELWSVPELPDHYLRRPDDLAPLKELVLGAGKAVGIVGAAPPQSGSVKPATVGVHGMGGIGKSVLAAAVVRDEEVRKAFRDGVIWLTIGQKPDLVARQTQLADIVEGSGQSFRDPQHGRAVLQGLLRELECLVILDDVWELKQAEAFRCLGPQGRLLLTTRDAALVRDLGASEYTLDVLSDEQALALLAGWAGTIADQLPPAALEVAKGCGNLPLALAMIGGLVQHNPEKWEHALHRLRSSDLEKIQAQFPGYPYTDLLRAIAVSVDALPEVEHQYYLDLAVFPEDTPIPPAALETFWALDKFDTRDVVDKLVNRSLARRDSNGHLTLHDLQRDYLRKLAEGRITTLHERLLAAYDAKRVNGWANGPNDGYFFQHLIHHLHAAERKDEARGLLLDFRWMRVRLQATGVVGLLADYDRCDADQEPILRLVQGAIRLSSHVLVRDGSQLASQLTGRLLGREEPEIATLLQRIPCAQRHPWLRPLTPSLAQAGAALFLKLEGHKNWVRAVAVTPNGRCAVSGSEDKTVRVWDLETGEALRTFEGHTGPVWAVDVTPDGHFAVSGADDRTLRVWDLETGETLRILESHTGPVCAVAITPDGRYVVSGSKDKTVLVWNLANGTLERALEGHKDSVSTVAITPDSRRAVSGSCDGTVRMWDLDSGKTLRTFKFSSYYRYYNPVRTVTITPNGQRVVAGYDDHDIRMWDIETGKVLRTLQSHKHRVNAVAVTPDGRIVSGSYDGMILVWDIETSEVLHALKASDFPVSTIAVTSNGRYAVSGYCDRIVRVWDIETGEVPCTLPGHIEGIRNVAVMPDKHRAVSVSIYGRLKVWDLDTGRQLHSFETSGGHGITSFDVILNSQHAVLADDVRGNTVRQVWDLETGQCIRELHGNEALAVIHNGLCTVDITLEGHIGRVEAVAITPNGQRAVTGLWDDDIRIWDLATGRTIAVFTVDARCECCTAVPDACTIVAGDYLGRVHFLRLEEGCKDNGQPAQQESLAPRHSDARPGKEDTMTDEYRKTIRKALIRLGFLKADAALPEPYETASGVIGKSHVYFLAIPRDDTVITLVAKIDEPERAASEWQAIEELRSLITPPYLILPVRKNEASDGVIIYPVAGAMSPGGRTCSLYDLLKAQLLGNPANCAGALAHLWQSMDLFYRSEPGAARFAAKGAVLRWSDAFPKLAEPGRVAEIRKIVEHDWPQDWNANRLVLPASLAGLNDVLPNPLLGFEKRLEKLTGEVMLSRIHGDLNF